MADSQGLKVFCGNIGNAFIQANTKEKVYTRVGNEFGEQAGKIASIIKALYGLATSAERFHSLLADFFKSAVSLQLDLIVTFRSDFAMINLDMTIFAHIPMTLNVLQKILACGLIVSLQHSLLRNQDQDLITLVTITHIMKNMICGPIPQKHTQPRQSHAWNAFLAAS